MKARHNEHNLSILKPIRYLASFRIKTPFASFGVGDPTPKLGEGVELGGRVWYYWKALHNGHNLSIDTEMLSLFVYEPIAIQILLGGPVP